MAQIIKNRRGSLDRLSSATGSLQKGEILIATGSSKLTGVTNGQGLVFAAVESGSVVAANRVLQGATAPIFSASSYGNLMDGIPFYASSSNTLFLLGADGNTTPDLTGNINSFSASVATSFSASAASIASVTGDFSSSVATSFSASNASVTALSASTYEAVFGFAGFSSSVATSLSQSAHNVGDLSGSIATTITNLSSSLATTDSASAAQISALSASVASVTGDFSSSVATSFSASAASQNALSGAIATTDSASAAYAASQLSSVSGAVATTIAGINAVNATFATTGSNTFKGNQIVSGTFDLFSVSSSFKIEGNGFGQTYFNGGGALVLNPGYGGVEVVGVNNSFKAANITADGTLSASVITGIGNVTDYSSSVNSRFSASAYEVSQLSASVASVGGTFSSSVATDFSASTAARVALSASIAVTDNSQSDRLDVIESTYATTGSNTFKNDQIISGSLTVTGDVTIYGSSSLLNVTASAVSIGTNTIVLNTASPAVRFGGISVIDSGSNAGTGSLWWDSINNHWLYEHPADSGAPYNSAILIAGPKNTGSLGEEIGLTTGYVPVAVGDDHIGNSIISASATKVTVEGALDVTGNISSSTISGIGNVTAYSTSVDSRVASIETSIGTGGSLGTRVSGLEALTGSYATTGSNVFKGEQIISSSLLVTNEIKGTGSIFLQPDSNDARKIEIYNTAATDVHIKATGGLTFLGDDTNYVLVDDSSQTISITGVNGVFVSSSLKVTGSISASEGFSGSIDGIGNVSLFSSSVDSRFSASAANVSSISGAFATSTSASNAEIASLSASVASVGGTFSSSVATDFSASAAARVALSASIALTDLTQSSNITNLTSKTGSYATTGSNVFNGDQVLTGSFDMTGTLNVNNAVAVNDSNMNLGNSSSLNLTGGSSIYVAGAGTISGSIVGIGNVSLYSASVNSRFSASAYDISILSASVASVGGTFSSSVATDFSASNAARVALSASVATDFSASNAERVALSSSVATDFSASAANVSSISGAFATSTSASNYQITELSASVASVGGTFSSSVATDFSASNAARVALSASIDTRLKAEEFKSTTFATTGSNSFTGSQGILGDVTISGSLTVQFGQDLITNHISGNQGRIELGNIDNNITIIADNELMLTATGSGVHVHSANFSVSPTGINNNVLVISASQTTITNELSASNISGVGNIGAFSQSVDSRFSASVYDISVLSASVASVGGTFSSSVATDFSASTAARVALSASIATTDNTQTGRIDALESYSSSLKTAIELTGSSVTIQGDLLVRGTTTSVNSTTIDLGDNIINLNGSGATNGGLYVKDVTNPNTATGSLLWDSTNDYWKAGVKDSESKVLVAVGDSVFSSSIQTALSGTFGYTDFSSSIATSFSASAASIASVTGDFSSSVATSFSASAASVTALSSSVATSFSASYASVTALSASIYQTDATQSTDITNNSSSFATSVSASNFRITVLETTIDGGSF